MSSDLALVVVDEVEATIDLLPLDRDIVIGRKAGCDVVLRSDAIATRHAEIALTGPDSLVVRSHAPSFGGVVLDGVALTGTKTVDPASEHRVQCFQHTVYVTPNAHQTIERVRRRLDERHADQLAVWRVAYAIAGRHAAAPIPAALHSLRAAPLVVVARGAGWRVQTATLFQVERTLRGTTAVGATVAVRLTPAQEVVVGLRGGVQRRVLDAFPGLRAQFSGAWLLHLESAPAMPDGEPTWVPIDETFGVLPATAGAVDAVVHAPRR